VIRATTRAGAAPYNERSLGLLRGKATAIEPARQRLEAGDGSTVIDITLPVFSYRKSLAQARPGETVSQLLIAYLHLGIGQDELFEDISPFMRSLPADRTP
jgi:hypothetical protein